VGIRMSQHQGPTPAAPPKLPATLRLRAVYLTLSDLDRSIAFYEDAIGLRLHHREDGVAAMGVGEEDLLILYEERRGRRLSSPRPVGDCDALCPRPEPRGMRGRPI